MKLKSCINKSIFEYPSLFRSVDLDSSRLLVLEHLFLVNGNGFDWNREGYLENQEVYDAELPEFPDDYFEKNLYEVEVLDEEATKAYLEIIAEVYHYQLPRSRFIIEGEQHASHVAHKWGKEKTFLGKPFLREANSGFVESQGLNPYPLCEYCAICEIMEGRTNSFHIANFDLTAQPDWLQGAIEIAEFALGYFKDDERIIFHCYYPKNDDEKEHWEKFRKKQIEFYTSFLAKFNTQ